MRTLEGGPRRGGALRTLRLPPGATDVRAGFVCLQECDPDARDVEHAKKVILDGRMISTDSSVITAMEPQLKKTSKLVSVSERNLQSAATRLLPKHNKLVSSEVDYLRRVLGDRATQVDIDEKVQLVRRLPWNEIVDAD